MEQIGQCISNGRQIFYTNIWTDQNWLDDLPSGNWVAFPVGQGHDVEIYSKLANRCIDNNVLYICAAGLNCELIHDIFDEVIVEKKIKAGESIDSPDDFENSPMTIWDNNFSEGFWFAVVVTYHDLAPIDQIVCIDFTKQGVKRHLTDLINKINNDYDWLPSDEEYEEPVYDKP
jgi:hypothetical protein